MSAPSGPDAEASPGRRDSFHHGNLRAAALTAALEMVERDGADALTLREVAKAAGVNHRALYRHFADRDDLAVAVAALGFEALGRAIAEAMAGSGRTPGGMLRGYLSFALDRPRLYGLMFGMRGADFLTHPVLAPAVRGVTDLAAEAFRNPGDPPGFSLPLRDRVMLAWGTAHGLCDLWQRGALRARGRAEAEAYILGLLDLSPGQGSA